MSGITKQFFSSVLTFLLLTSIAMSVDAQEQRDSTFFIGGRIYDKNTGHSLTYAHIINLNLNAATVSNRQGFFILEASAYDTLYISHIGYKKRLFYTKSKSDSFFLYSIPLFTDTFMLKPYNVFGATPLAQFRSNFISHRLPKDTINPAFTRFVEEENHFTTLETSIVLPGPVTMLYNHFNRSARLKRKLEQNRAQYYDNLPEEERQKVIFYDEEE